MISDLLSYKSQLIEVSRTGFLLLKKWRLLLFCLQLQAQFEFSECVLKFFRLCLPIYLKGIGTLLYNSSISSKLHYLLCSSVNVVV
ncbi:unnamed protein product [Brassica rapa subsp. trilocularis]